MPQISQVAATYASQLFWLLLTFGLTFFVVGLGMFPKVQGTVRLRDDKIKGDLEAARSANAEADALEERYRVQTNVQRGEAQGRVAAAKAEAASAREAELKATDLALKAKLDAAESLVNERRNAALGEIETVAAEAAQAMAARVAGLELNEIQVCERVRTMLHG